MYALAVSVLWHLLWFFLVTIVVQVPKKKSGNQPVIVSFGPVLDDIIFKTLVETRPEISKAFYRQPADFSSATDVPTETVERYSTGDVISVPSGKKFMAALKNLVGGGKISPEGITAAENYFEIITPTNAPAILSRPPAPSAAFVSAAQPTEIEFLIDAHGKVSDVEVVASSGDSTVDHWWENHLQQWIFSEVRPSDSKSRLRVRFH
jgi:hypothetical protein